MTNIAVKVENVEKSFKLPIESSTSLKRTIVNYFKGVKGYKKQQVLNGVSFDVEKGDFFGILGRNGSGKSTLLKIISQIYNPENGSVTIDGKLVSFIELGVGFNPELTGKENVYLNGAMLGFTTAEVDAMYDDIVEFAELHEFMNQKLKNYSSGMQVRLAFSVAIKAQGDILILDEVLAVGDEAFQRKCNDYFLERKKSGKTTILVTHDMGAVKKYCNKAILIEDGVIKKSGNPFDVANEYSFKNAEVIHEVEDQEETKEQEIYVENLHVNLLSGTSITPKDKIKFNISYTILQDIPTYIAFSLTDIDRNIWIYNDNSMDHMTTGIGNRTASYECSLESLNDIRIKLEVTVRDSNGNMLAFSNADDISVIQLVRKDIPMNDVSALDAATGLVQRNGEWEIWS